MTWVDKRDDGTILASPAGAGAGPDAPAMIGGNDMTREYITQADGTLWLCAKTSGPDREVSHRSLSRAYWCQYMNGPASNGIVGFYAASIDEARTKLGA